MKLGNVVTTDVNQAYGVSTVKGSGPEESSAYEIVRPSAQSPDPKNLDPIYEGIADD